MLFGFFSNFTPDDLACKAIITDDDVMSGAGATIQFNADRCVNQVDDELILVHSGQVTVGNAIKRADLVSKIRSLAPQADDALGGLDPEDGWPLRLGGVSDLAALIDRTAVYVYAVEQAKRSIRVEPPLPPLFPNGPLEQQVDPASGGGAATPGFQPSAAVRKAVELHAMAAAIAHYQETW